MFRSLMSAIAVAVTATVMMVDAVQAADDAKYPDWKGAWTRWFPPGSTLDPMVASRPAVSLPTTRPSPGGEDRKPHSLRSIERYSRTALRTKPMADRAIFLTMLFVACPEACRS
jgi:hypothetical protein